MKEFLKNNLNIILTWLFIFFVAGLGSLFVNLEMAWYEGLNKPSQWIPNIVIPIMWTVIYLSFGIILTILYKNQQINKRIIVLGIINGLMNILWCLVFFTLNQLLLGNIIIILNAFFGILLLCEMVKIKFWYVNILWLYPIWLLLATTLNNALWILN